VSSDRAAPDLEPAAIPPASAAANSGPAASTCPPVAAPPAAATRAGAGQAGTAGGEPVAASPKPTVWEQMGGPMGMVDSGLPVVVFVIVNAIGSLSWAIVTALIAGVIIAGIRLIRHKPVTQAVAGLFGVGLAAFIAYRTGSAKGYFLFGIWSYLAYGSLLLVSIVVRRPLIGVLWESLNGRGSAWRAAGKLVRRYDYATAVWVLVFAARFTVQNQLYDADQVGWLATARLLMGYPLYFLAIAVTVLIVGSGNGMSLPSGKTMFGAKKTGD